MPLDEGALRESYPEILWDQPVKLIIPVDGSTVFAWGCRYCIALQGIRAQDVLLGVAGFASPTTARDHIEETHHD